MEASDNGEEGSDSEVAELRLKVESLKEELQACTAELVKLQKQLSCSKRTQECTERYNEDLRKQVEQLSAVIHEQKRKEKDKATAETQTEEYVWTETDYYNYYHGAYSQNATETQGDVTSEAPGDVTETTEDAAGREIASDAPGQLDGDVAAKTEEADGGSIADMLRATAEEAMTQTGFVFDETTGMYYDHSTGFYYDSASQLYYDANTGIYYYYDAESGRYQFHSKIELPAVQASSEPGQDKKSTEKKVKKSKKGPEKSSHQYDKVQEVANSLANMKISSGCNTADHRAEEVWPPCVRVMVVRSPVLQVGTLFILTADAAATIGRDKDMDHAIRIPEIGVSKFHVEVYFDTDQQGYMLVDQGSQNGTVINGNRILQPQTKCEPYALTHGDEVKVGETVLSFHIHSGTGTCDGCEPGQVIAHLSKHKRGEATGPAPIKEDKERLRKKELRQIKVKYGLKGSEYEDAKVVKSSGYKDRAETRRQRTGKDETFQRDPAPASVHVEISDANKGRKMLEKMGWKKGRGLGRDGAGITDPIELKLRKPQSGLGVANASLLQTQTQRNWEKARERFADSCQPDGPSSKAEEGKSLRSWVKAETE